MVSYFISFSLLSFNNSKKLAKNLLASLLILGIFVLVENISIIFFLTDNTINFQKIEADKVLVLAVFKILLLLVSIIIYTIFYPKEKHIIPRKYYLLLPLLISISAIFTTSIILINDITGSSKILLLVFLLINISISFYIYYAMVGLIEEKNKQMALENQYELIKLQNESIKKSTEDLRRLEHDLKTN